MRILSICSLSLTWILRNSIFSCWSSCEYYTLLTSSLASSSTASLGFRYSLFLSGESCLVFTGLSTAVFWPLLPMVLKWLITSLLFSGMTCDSLSCWICRPFNFEISLRARESLSWSCWNYSVASSLLILCSSSCFALSYSRSFACFCLIFLNSMVILSNSEYSPISMLTIEAFWRSFWSTMSSYLSSAW